jgi:hypothetical protein
LSRAPRILTAAAVAVAAFAFAAVAAGAVAGPGFSSRITIHLDRDGSKGRFSGKVRSERNACERGRKVVLFGQETGAPAERIGKTHTNDNGRWRIRHRVNFANFYAKVKRSEIGAGPCRADVSKPVDVKKTHPTPRA